MRCPSLPSPTSTVRAPAPVSEASRGASDNPDTARSPALSRGVFRSGRDGAEWALAGCLRRARWFVLCEFTACYIVPRNAAGRHSLRGITRDDPRSSSRAMRMLGLVARCDRHGDAKAARRQSYICFEDRPKIVPSPRSELKQRPSLKREWPRVLCQGRCPRFVGSGGEIPHGKAKTATIGPQITVFNNGRLAVELQWGPGRVPSFLSRLLSRLRRLSSD